MNNQDPYTMLAQAFSYLICRILAEIKPAILWRAINKAQLVQLAIEIAEVVKNLLG